MKCLYISNPVKEFPFTDESIDSFSYCGSIIQLSNRSICPNMDSYSNSNMAYAQSWPSLNKPPGIIKLVYQKPSKHF